MFGIALTLRRFHRHYAADVALDDLRKPYDVPIRQLLIGKADVVPPSLHNDALHLDDRGEAVVAVSVEAAIRRGEW